jgi:hypothetical protein
MAGSLLALTVAPSPTHPLLPGVSRNDPPADYNDALGNSGGTNIAVYRVVSRIPVFVGKAYPGEQLLTWYPKRQQTPLIPELGVFEGETNWIVDFPRLTAAVRTRIAERRPAVVLFVSQTGADFGAALKALAPYRPHLLRRTVLAFPPVHVHLWLVSLGAFQRSST